MVVELACVMWRHRMFHAARVDGHGILMSERAVDELEIDRYAGLIPLGQAIWGERVVKTE